MKKIERADALTILTALLQKKTPLSYLLQSNPSLSPLTKEICFGVSRHYLRLEAIANLLLTKRPKELDVWLCILIGLYQLHFLNIPDYAVVKETVALLDHVKKSWAKGLVNAILRRFCREKESIVNQLSKSTSYTYGHPDWFIKLIKKHWPNNWHEILIANDCHPPMSLRINHKHTDINSYLSRLKEIDMGAVPSIHAPCGIILNKPCAVHDLPGFADGHVSVQDLAAQMAVSLLDLKPGLRVLDACCAPGGKTCHILETEPKLESCVALDIENHRLLRVKENLSRLNLHATLKLGDGLTPENWWDGVPYDRILLDAPCSATGVIRRHPDIKLLRTQEEINAISELQKGLLNALWPLLAPGGILVYATCSIMPEENEHQIANFIAQNKECQSITPTQTTWGHHTGNGIQILPGENDMDGFFYSVLTNKGNVAFPSIA